MRVRLISWRVSLEKIQSTCSTPIERQVQQLKLLCSTPSCCSTTNLTLFLYSLQVVLSMRDVPPPSPYLTNERILRTNTKQFHNIHAREESTNNSLRYPHFRQAICLFQSSSPLRLCISTCAINIPRKTMKRTV